MAYGAARQRARRKARGKGRLKNFTISHRRTAHRVLEWTHARTSQCHPDSVGSFRTRLRSLWKRGRHNRRHKSPSCCTHQCTSQQFRRAERWWGTRPLAQTQLFNEKRPANEKPRLPRRRDPQGKPPVQRRRWWWRRVAIPTRMNAAVTTTEVTTTKEVAVRKESWNTAV